MREIDTHKANGCNEALQIVTPDDLTVGGSPTTYGIILTAPDGSTYMPPLCEIRFQDGPIPVVGTNGVTHEALTAVLIDRLEHFQAGPFACDQNAEALGHYRFALAALKRRTEARLARGVEGTHQK